MAKVTVLSGNKPFQCGLYSWDDWNYSFKFIKDINPDVEYEDLSGTLIFTIDKEYEVTGIYSEPVGYVGELTSNNALKEQFPDSNVWECFVGYPNLGDVVSVIVGFSGGIELISPLNKLHLLDGDLLESLGDVPMIQPTSEAQTSSIYNLTGFIINLLAIPFKIPQNYIDTDSAIKLGNYLTNVSTPLLNSDLVIFDLGSIDVGDLYNNSLDFENVEYELILPYVDKVIKLTASDVVGKLINVKYSLDCYSGDVTINIFNGGDDPIHSTKGALGRSIPIKILQDVENNLGGFSGLYNGVKSCFLRVTRPNVIFSKYNNLISIMGTLAGEGGFILVDDIDLKTRASYSEAVEIKSLLSNGVNINA